MVAVSYCESCPLLWNVLAVVVIAVDILGVGHVFVFAFCCLRWCVNTQRTLECVAPNGGLADVEDVCVGVG